MTTETNERVAELAAALGRPGALGQGQLLLIVAAQVLRFGHMARMDGAVVETAGFAESERRSAGQHAAGDRSDKGDELDNLPCRLPQQHAQSERAGQFRETGRGQRLPVERGQVVDHSGLDTG